MMPQMQFYSLVSDSIFQVFYQDHIACVSLMHELRQYLKTQGFYAIKKQSGRKPDRQGVIFSIVRDNRIPKEVESWINQHAVNCPTSVFLLGDFDSADETLEHEILFETQRMLTSRFTDLSYDAFIYDTPILDYGYAVAQSVPKLEAFLCTQRIRKNKHRDTVTLNKKNISENHEIFSHFYWQKLKDLLGEQPYVEEKSDGSQKYLSIELTDKQRYPRSMVQGWSAKSLQEIWRCLDHIPSIGELRISYGDIEQWPKVSTPNLYSTLVKLDIRCNHLHDFKFLKMFRHLKTINISANNLHALPHEIYTLKYLEVLFAYKNSIKTLSSQIGQCKYLKRLSMYRNLLETLPKEIAQCTMLENINIGANPIKTLPKEIRHLKHLKLMSIRNCKLTGIPAALQGMHSVALNTEKNPLVV